ncbi:MAG TPA: hypothetical protein V6C88_05420 [Chroococcidiopsis sp.]
MISSDAYARLELISAQSSEPLLYPPQPLSQLSLSQPPLSQQTLFVNVAQRIWRSLNAFATGNQEPQIHRKCDRHGHTYFWVYDPASQQSQTLDTEHEVRAWLEQRYGQ